MMRRAAGTIAGALCVCAMSAAQATFDNYQPTTFGKPWTVGQTSFDWDEWSYADNTLTNQASNDRRWTVPFVTEDLSEILDLGVGTVMLRAAGSRPSAEGSRQ